MTYGEIIIGQEIEYVRDISVRDVMDFALLSGDTNSAHLGSQNIVHGMLIMSYISMIIGTQLPGDGAIWASSDIKFIQPIFIGDTIAITATVKKKNDISKCIKIQIDVSTRNGLCLATNNWIYIQ